MARRTPPKYPDDMNYPEEIEQKFHFDRTYEILLDGEYTGRIIRCRIEAYGDSRFLVMEIRLDGLDQIFRSKHKIPLSPYSALNNLFEEILGEYGGDIECRELIGLDVWFETAQNERNGYTYCNIKSIGLMDDEDDEDDEDDSDGDEDDEDDE